MGDVNINLLKYNSVNSITNYIHDIQSAGCLSFIDKPTRKVRKIDGKSTALITYIQTFTLKE